MRSRKPKKENEILEKQNKGRTIEFLVGYFGIWIQTIQNRSCGCLLLISS